MANLLIVVDPDEHRRAAFTGNVHSELAFMPGLRSSRVGSGLVDVLWASSPSAPVNVADGSEGGAIVWGDAIGDTGGRATGRDILDAWMRPGDAACWDGFFAAATWNVHGTLTVGCDLLGIFPLYWWSDGEVALVGSSPELFSRHPRFEARFDPAGFAGILMTNGLVAGRTLWKGVQRLSPGHVLRLKGPASVREELQYQVPMSDRYADLPFRGHADVMGDALADAVNRHCPEGDPYGILLSGGLDSRMLAGFMGERGIRPRALTLGLSTDLEMRCAKSVARELGLEHVTAEPDQRSYHEYASLHSRWEHLGQGFTTIRDWETQAHVGALAPRVVVGCLADNIVGAVSISWAYDQEAREMSFETFWRRMPQLGIRPQVLDDLLDRDFFHDSVQGTVAEIRDEFHSLAETDAGRAWQHDLKHGARFHVGGTIWRLSFGSWPVVPVLDRRVLETMGALPPAALSDRLAQLRLLTSRFPRLAELPMDRSELSRSEAELLQPRVAVMLREYLRARYIEYRRKLRVPGLRGREVRYWYRINDFNGAGWRSVRALAEPGRESLRGVFDLTALESVLPAPRRFAPGPERWIPESGRKLLTGFLIWAQSHPVS